QDENTRRDVTDVMIDIGFEISKMGEGEITAWWGVLVADRDVSDAGSYLPIVLSSIDESGHILFDGKGDGRIDGTFYIARKSGDSSGGSGNGGGGCGIGLGALAFLACLWILRRKH
ncbi:MAG: hypothetical protein LBP21_11945, partial [Synergistaceae bacterium]|nr:hypothetical protein [Synergistaceae bacterium]